jgi:hypothetical protein
MQTASSPRVAAQARKLRAFTAKLSYGPAFAVACFLSAGEAGAQEMSIDDIRARIVALEAENERKIEQIRKESAEQIGALKAALAQIGGQPVPAATTAGATSAPAVAARGQGNAIIVQPRATVDNSAVPAPRPVTVASNLQISGDLRLRYEQNFSEPRRARGREVLRGRLRANYTIDRNFSLGARIVTGDPDDPNSADITLTQFDDDLAVGLDLAYAKASFGALDLYAGKFDNPFVRTDLVWDGDVNPEGLAAIYTLGLGGSVKLRASGLYVAVDEAPAARDSKMVGGQLALSAKPGPDWQADIGGGYYDYSLDALTGADAGDFRTNLLRPGGGYLSDFDLLNIVGSLTYTGLGTRWPVRFVGDYVRNLGAAVSDDEGFGADLFVGRASDPGDWRFQYGYARMGVDGTLTAFSHDNTDLASNYVQHTLAIDHVPAKHVVLNATYYRYRVKSPLYTPGFVPGDWYNRLRLNLIYAW